MQEWNEKITALRKKIQTNEEAVREKLVELGQGVMQQEPAKLLKTPLEELFKAVAELEKLIPARKQDIQQILDLEESLKESGAGIKEKKQKIAEREKEIQQYLPAIGECAYNTYQADPVQFAAYQEFFADVLLNEEKISKAVQSQQDLAARGTAGQGGNPFKKLFSMAKTVYYEKKHDLMLARQEALFKQAGAKVLDSDFVTQSDNSELQECLAPVENLHNQLAQLSTELQNLQKRAEKLNRDLQELGVQSGVSRRIKELEKELEQISASRKARQQELGQLYLEKAGELKLSDKQLEKSAAGIAALREENRGYEAEIVKHEARISVWKIGQKITKNEGEIKNLEERIAADKAAIKDLDSDIQELAQEKASIIQKHGLED